MMRQGLFAFLVTILILGLTPGCEKKDEISGPSGVDGTPDVPENLALAQTFPPILANGTDQVTVRATVVDGRGKGLSDIGVFFTTSRGSIEPFATTGSDGTARTILTSEASTADIIATVRAQTSADSSVSPMSESPVVLVSNSPPGAAAIAEAIRLNRDRHAPGAVPLTVTAIEDQVEVPMTGVTLTLRANPSTIPADGISQSRLEANLVETTSRIPLAGETVRFGSSAGTVTGEVNTDQAGSAIAVLAARPDETSAAVTAFYGKTLTASTSVQFSPLTLTLSTETDLLVADGTSTTNLVARLINEEGNPVVGARIGFATTLGTVLSPVDTGADGTAVTTLVAGTNPGTGEVTARFSDALAASVTITFVDLPTTDELILAVEPTELPADGASQATLTATALDGDGNPVPDGTAVSFSIVSGGGQIIGPVGLTQGGVAEAAYVAGPMAGSVTVRASSGTAVKDTPIVLTELDVGDFALTANPTSILADGNAMCRLSATVRDRFGNPVIPGTVVQFVSSNGLIEDVTPTDASGVASARLRAHRFVTGMARVTASAGSFQETADVKFVSEAAAHIEALEADPPSIGVLGASDHETASITFEVQDRHGIPVDLDHAVQLSFSIIPDGGETDATVHPPTAVTNEFGLAIGTVNSGIISGAVEVFASTDGLFAEPIRVAIYGGLPDPNHFSISFTRINLQGLLYDGVIDTVRAFVGDLHGNPVPESTIVYFFTDFGIIQGGGFTDDIGRATVLFTTAGVRPGDPWSASICAHTINHFGELMYRCGDVLWTGDTEIEFLSPDTLRVPNGGSQEISFRVSDQNGSPLTAGTRIRVSSTDGQLGGFTDFEIPDTQDPAYTIFSVVLEDDDAETLETRSVTVTVAVTSANGNLATFITGTLDYVAP